MKECPACSRCYPDHVNHCPADGDALRLTITGDTVLDGRYQLERRLGQGGMGAVFKGRHVFLKTTHAIKIILPDLVGNDPSLVTRFRQEAMAAAAIHHPNIISVTDFGVVNNTMPFLVMEFIEGRSLHELLAAEKRLDPARALEIMLAVASGVGEAHRQGIVHRDLKPLNIMLRDGHSASGGLKVLDFGLAKIKSTDLLGSFVAAKTQGLMGSPFYMAPEQWGDDEPDLLADIYSMGVILYQMLAGEVPFRGNSIPAIMKKHLSEPHAPLAEKGVSVPPEVDHVIAHALEKDLERRTPTADEFIAELYAALDVVRPPVASGPITARDLGQRTVPITEPPTIPPGAPSASGPLPASDLEQGMKTVAEPPPHAEAAPTTGDLAAPPDASPSLTEVARPTTTPTRETAHDLAGGTAVIRPEEGKSGTSPLDETSLAPLPSEAEGVADAWPKQQIHVTPSKSTQPLGQQQQTVHPATSTPLPAPEASPPPPPALSETPPVVVVPAAAPPPYASTPAVTSPHAPAVATPHAPAVPAPRTRITLPLLAAAGVLALLCVVAGLYIFLRSPDETTNANAGANLGANTGPGANTSANTNAAPSPTPQPTPSVELVALPGGTFQIGRNDVPPRTSNVSLAYQAWAYNQWPAHAVRIAPFRIDRTEVTNAEYAVFVAQTGYQAPTDWGARTPPPGQEQFPVRNVSLDDAKRFANWRSQRDRAEYRLPTEVEWEYAARGGDATRLFPWGREWEDGRANVEAETVRSVGSFSAGATPQGVEDMIGNVWEWTETQAAMYPGNNLLRLAPGDNGKYIVRGGSYQSKARGDEPISSTSRRWVARDTRDPVVGFRLVRSGN